MSTGFQAACFVYWAVLILLSITVCLHFKTLAAYRTYLIFPVALLNETAYWLTGNSLVYDLLFPCVQSLIYLAALKDRQLSIPYKALNLFIICCWTACAVSGIGSRWHLAYYFVETAGFIVLYSWFILRYLRRHKDPLGQFAILYILYDKLLDMCFHLISYTAHDEEILSLLQNSWIITQSVFTGMLTAGILYTIHQKKHYA